ncbi:carbohydrate ABC transporter permease [Alphaproteobacteria bacterium]|jgi:multiple sugar transport system permease protein|nr:carbohydrate ABC transporter permease [Alphaproteobacteria bacterium]|tara:strand:- start:523 stop:1425 length:903 start_codon:yes stop_codon:yes gene_type:complete
MKRYSSDWYWYYVINYTLVIIIIFPIYWTLISSFKKPHELITSEPTFYPQDITLQYYDQMWNFDRQKRLQDTEAEDMNSYLLDGDGIKRPFLNSAIVSLGTIILTIIVCTLGAYALTILNTPFKNFIFMLMILPILIPGISLIIPLYKLMREIGLTDSHLGLIFLHTTAMLPLGVFMMRNAFNSIPKSLREVAMLEGSSELNIITKVMLPLAIPGLLTVMVFAMYISWNDYILAFLFINSPENTMLNISLMKIALGGSQFEMKWGSLTAGSIVSFLPIIIFYTFLQQYFVRGVTGSAVKE